MRTRTVTTYISDDGKEFEHESECMRYEFNKVCKEGAVKFYSKDGVIEEPINEKFDDIGFYNSVIRIEVDRTKPEKVKQLCDLIEEWYGWVLIIDALRGNGNEYIWYEDKDFTKSRFVEVKG